MLAFLKNQNFFLFELFVVFKILAILSPNIATNMIVQDKLCLVNHHQSSHFCQNLQNKMEYSKDQKMKNEILTEAARFTNYKYKTFLFIDVTLKIILFIEILLKQSQFCFGHFF